MKNKKYKVRGSLMGKAAEEWEGVLWDDLMEVMAKFKSKKELQTILESLLSASEKKIILRRLAAAVLLKEGLPYRRIGEMLWIAPATISSIKKNMVSRSAHHRSHRTIYKKDMRNFTNNKKDSLTDDAVDLVAYFVEGLAKAFLSKGIGITGDRK